MRRVRAYIGLGGNVGHAEATLGRAVRTLATLPGVHLRAVSRLYVTKPVGVVDQADFHNAVVALDVPAGRDPVTGALALLIALKGIERAFGRRGGRRWGPRGLDLDLLVFGRHQIRAERPVEARRSDLSRRAEVPSVDAPHASALDVPHASARERLFVLAPLADLAPGLTPPGWGETVRSARLRQEKIERSDAVRPIARWDPNEMTWR